jgi:small subunit ribosomal protein S20
MPSLRVNWDISSMISAYMAARETPVIRAERQSGASFNRHGPAFTVLLASDSAKFLDPGGPAAYVPPLADSGSCPPSNLTRTSEDETSPMANTPQARKRIRRNEARTEVLGARRSAIRTFVKKVESAIAAGDKDAAKNALQAAQPQMQRGVAKGVLHKNTASRKLSRLSARIAALS